MKQDNIINLPEDILISNGEKSEKIIFHDYTATGSSRGKSVLNKNAISLVINGEKTMHFADKTVHIKSDEFHFLSSGNCVASMDPSGKEAFRTILLFFDNKTLSDFFIKYSHLIDQFKHKEKNFGRHYVPFKKDRFVSNYIVSLDLLLQSRGKLSTAMRLLKFEELLLHLLETYPDKLLSFQTSKNVSTNDLEIRKAVETNVTNQLNLEELAFLCHTSLSTFKRRFIKLYGMPPNKWILQKRMEVAKNLLINHKEKPSEIYYKLGFENHSSFTQSFKKNFGITPKEFQQQQLNVYQ
jgi:AraC family transcriptional regulator, exoenzyme S synthesis regulatory protein ExsA